MSGFLLATLLAGCMGEGDYEVRWTVGNDQADVGCPRSGLDTVVLDWVDGEPGVCAGDLVDSTEHACGTGVARGFLDVGTYNLCAEALSPDHARFTGVVVASDVPVRHGDLVIVTLPLPVVPECRNGLDDEPDGGDGRIDDRDPQCSDDSDAAE